MRRLARINTGLAALTVLVLGGCRQPQPPPNLLLITVDTLRADRLETYGYARPTSPAIATLAERAVVFEASYAHSPWTVPSLASLMTSLPPVSHGCWTVEDRLAPAFTTLAERLQAGDWSTGAITAHPLLGNLYGLDQGFETFHDDLTPARDGHKISTSEAVTDAALDWLEPRLASDEEAAKPWFLWVHYFDPHWVYLPHEGSAAAFGDAESDLYDGEIAFTDHAIGRLLDRLQSSPGSQSTVTLLTADHGEEFGDHGGSRHGHTLYDELLRAPLLLQAPGFAPRRVSTPVGQIDIAPTLLALLGLKPELELTGRSLLPALTGGEVRQRPILAQLGRQPEVRLDSLIDGPWKLIVDRNDGGRQLFRLAEDADETHNLAEREVVTADLLTQRLDDLLQQAPAPATSDPQTLEPEAEEALRSLGYID